MKNDYSYRKAKIVLEILLNMIEENQDLPEKGECIIGCYQNGREQGFEVLYWPDNIKNVRNVTFSEYRTSDQIVVYPDNKEMQGLSDEAYANGKFFDNPTKAAECCFQHLFRIES